MRTSRKSPKKKAEIEFKKLVRELCSPREPVRQEVRRPDSRRSILAEIEKRRIREAAEEERRNPVEDPFAAVRAQARERAKREIAEREDEADVRRVREMAERIKERRAGARIASEIGIRPEDMLNPEIEREMAQRGSGPRFDELRKELESRDIKHYGSWV